MKKLAFIFLIGSCTVLFGFNLIQLSDDLIDEKKILSHVVDLQQQELNFYWKDKQGKNYANFKQLKAALALENKELLFAMSKVVINLYDFATYFKQKGCKNALYLDGFVSQTYLPNQVWKKLDGNFGVIIGETKK